MNSERLSTKVPSGICVFVFLPFVVKILKELRSQKESEMCCCEMFSLTDFKTIQVRFKH